MKAFSIITIVFTLLINCNTPKKTNNTSVSENKQVAKKIINLINKDTTFTFENYKIDQIPTGWSQDYTGRGDHTKWQIVNDNGNHVLAQLSYDQANYHFNEIVLDGISTKNVSLEVKMKGVRGKKDQGGGFVWRYTDKDNYYVVRANPLEDNVVLYKVKNGKRTDLTVLGKGRTYGVDVDKLGSDWNNLKLIVVDDLFTVYLNDKEIFKVKDQTFTESGKIGLWTKADAVSYFDDFVIKLIK
jgi:hypothetical protein